MKISTIFACAAVFLAACGNENDSGKKSPPRDLEEGFKFLKSLNVGDARMIYRRETPTRAEGGEGGYWKIDLSGNETRLVITDAEGKAHDIGIGKVVKLSDRILLIDPDVIQIMDLISPIGPDETISVSLFGYLSIVDVETEKLYRWPQELKKLLGYDYDWNFRTASDKAGNVYFTLDDNHNPYGGLRMVYKLDVVNYTIQPLLPEGEEFTDFLVTADGFLFYWQKYNQKYYVKCPAGNIIPLTGSGFCSDDKVYTLENGTIHLWEPAGDNALDRKAVCPADGIGNSPVLTNAVRKTAVFESWSAGPPEPGYFWAVEFDGTGFSEPFQLPDTFREIERSPAFPDSSRAWYLFNQKERSLHKLLMQDYTEHAISIADYEIQQLTSESGKADLHFTGFRYSDGKNVVGTITESDEIVVETVSDSGKVIELIAIN